MTLKGGGRGFGLLQRQPFNHLLQRYGDLVANVLIVTTGEKRLNHLKQVAEAVGASSRFWFTTLNQVTTSNLLSAPMWHRAGFVGAQTLLS